MGPAQAIRGCLARSFTFSARASRSEYWLFLLPGLSLPVAVYGVLRLALPETGVISALALAAPALLPLAAVTARRLADAGENPADIHPPTAALVVFLFALLAIEGFAGWTGAMIEAAGSPGGFWLAILLAPVFLVMLAAAAAVFFFGLLSGAWLFGQMILPSQPGPNRYGPNPSEVTP